MGWKHGLTFLALAVVGVANTAEAQIRITEVAPWSSSGNTSLDEDWFELTNFGSSAVNITGWRVDDGSNSFGSSLQLFDIPSIAPGESVIFIETAAPGLATEFKQLWFNGSPAHSAALQIGRYSGSGIGLSTDGDAVNIYNSGGALQTRVTFGASSGPPFATFDNSLGLNDVSLTGSLSVAGVHGAFTRPTGVGEALMTGSPGSVPEPSTVALFVLGAVASLGGRRSRRGQ